MGDCGLNHGLEVQVVRARSSHVPRVDPVFVEGLRAGRELREKAVSIVVEVADQGDGHSSIFQALSDLRNRRGCFRGVDRHPDHLASRLH